MIYAIFERKKEKWLSFVLAIFGESLEAVFDHRDSYCDFKTLDWQDPKLTNAMLAYIIDSRRYSNRVCLIFTPYQNALGQS